MRFVLVGTRPQRRPEGMRGPVRGPAHARLLGGGPVVHLHETQGEIVGVLLNADLVEDVEESRLLIAAERA